MTAEENEVIARARSEIRDLQPYSHATFQPGLLRLHANELPWPGAHADDANEVNRYPEPRPRRLAQLAGDYFGVPGDAVFLSHGSDEAIDLLVRAFCSAGEDAIVTCPPTFGMYAVAAKIQGAGIIEVPLTVSGAWLPDFDRLQSISAPGVKIIFLCSPNNPTGNCAGADEILALARFWQGRSLVVVDEAYIEFADQASLARHIERHPNLVVLRTMSKAHGLAGARLGVALARPAIVQLLQRIAPPYSLSNYAIAAGIAAMQPLAIARTRARIDLLRAERARMTVQLTQLPAIAQLWPSDANFLLVRCYDSVRLMRAALAAGILVRDQSAALNLDNCLRVSIGAREDNDRLLEAWQ
ncbi:MAG: histidinol-phosphate transaminase [Steroidobacteraceae bacterium]